MSTPLGDRIKSLIRANGPISVAEYFSLCLSDPQHGYYKTKQPFGSEGDFTTAPEISQLFGEMIGIFLVHAWQQQKMPQNIRLIEIGPGRGTMMLDVIRVISQLAPTLYQTLTIHMVETSEKLAQVQAQTLSHCTHKISWHKNIEDVPEGFSLIAANELFDAIPIRQFVRNQRSFVERVVALGPDDELAFIEGSGGIDLNLLPEGPERQQLGAIFEYSPARDALMQLICERLKTAGGTFVTLDYGHLKSGYGDTLQALKKHQFDPVLASPGEADLTSHVDFEALSKVAIGCGVAVSGMMSQGDFLYGLGLPQRATALAQKANEEQRVKIVEAVNRLAGNGDNQMGDLFKVLAVSSPSVDLAPFKASH